MVPLVWSAQLIKDIKELSFYGEDILGSFALRFRGLSAFSLAPISEANIEASTAARTEMMQYEFIEGQGYVTAADQKALAKLDGSWSSVPGTRFETATWVDHIRIMIQMILGDRCPLNPIFDKLYHNMSLCGNGCTQKASTACRLRL